MLQDVFARKRKGRGTKGRGEKTGKSPTPHKQKF